MAGPLSVRVSSTIQLMLAQSTYPSEATNSNYTVQYATSLLSRIIAEPMPVRCSICGQLYGFKISPDDWKVEADVETSPSTEEVASLGSNAKYVHFHGIKITPPPITNAPRRVAKTTGGKEHIHSISTKVEIQAVLTHLQKQLGSLQLGSHHWLFASNNCRVTTSVSPSDGSSFPLSTAKKVAFIKTAWLRHFDSMSEPQCITSTPPFNDHIGVYLDEWLMKIKKAPGFSSLSALLHGMKIAGVFDIENGSAGGSPRSVDTHDLKEILHINKISSCDSFRLSQQASTLNPKQILAWQDVCEKIVLRAHAAEGTYFAWQFSPEGEFRAPSFGVRDMLRELAVKNSTTAFFEKRHAKDSPDTDDRLAQALNSVMNVLGPLALYKANAVLGSSSEDAVREKVLAKMRSGAYGRLSEEFIQAVGDCK